MSDRPDAERDPELEEYLAAFREVETPTRAEARATWAAIETQTRSARRGPWIAVAFAAAAALLVLAYATTRRPVDRATADALGEQTPYEHRQEAGTGTAVPRAPAAVPRSPAPAVPTARAPAAEPAEVAPEPEQVVPAPAPVAPRVAPRPRTPPSATASSSKPAEPSALAQEIALIGRIRSAVADGRGEDALALVAEHARRFPRGTFAEERTLAKARALCGMGRRDDARRVADAFVAAHPASHLVSQMKSICE